MLLTYHGSETGFFLNFWLTILKFLPLLLLLLLLLSRFSRVRLCVTP